MAGLTLIGFAMAGCAQTQALLVGPDSDEEEAEVTPVDPATPPIPYEVEITGIVNEDLRQLLRESSQLIELQERPPKSLAGLRRRVEADLDRFETALRSEGYYAGAAAAEIDRTRDPIAVAIQVKPGEQYVLKDYTVRYQGPAAESAVRPSLEELDLMLGQPARAPEIVAAQKDLLKTLGRNGYPLASVVDREAVVNHDTKTMTVALTVEPGPFATFGAPSIQGLTDVETDYVERLVTWEPGRTFDEKELVKTREQLAATGLFAAVQVTPGEEVGPDGRLPVTITVNEAPHRSIGFGASYSTSEGFAGDVFWEHRNLFGDGERLRLELLAAQIEQSFTARYTKPTFLNRDQELIIETEFANRDTDAFEEQSATGLVALRRPFGDHWTGTAGISAEYSIITDDEGEETFQLLGLPVTAIYDTSNSLLDPTEGVRLTAAVTPFTGVGDDALFFTKGSVAAATYYAIDEDARYVLAGRARVGSIVGEDTDDIPANKRFYAGGGGSIRGYEFQKVGPLDDEGDPLGGRSVLELNAEVRVRVTDTIGIVPFVDGGTAFDDPVPTFDETVRWAGGLGLRYFSPVGPVRLDVAFPLNPRPIDDTFQFYISLGQAF